jgi:hypothetical protein
MVQLLIVVGFGGGVDSIEATLELLRDPIVCATWPRRDDDGADRPRMARHQECPGRGGVPAPSAARVRTIQVARRGLLKKDGVVVLDDTDQPTTCYTRPTRALPYFTLVCRLLAAKGLCRNAFLSGGS